MSVPIKVNRKKCPEIDLSATTLRSTDLNHNTLNVTEQPASERIIEIFSSIPIKEKILIVSVIADHFTTKLTEPSLDNSP